MPHNPDKHFPPNGFIFESTGQHEGEDLPHIPERLYTAPEDGCCSKTAPAQRGSIRYMSKVAEYGTFNEYVLTNRERTYIEYVIAYRRTYKKK